ncbi:hypothetical protein [Flavobacterium urocaniciphilum]|uniref:Uncharacterized protein n=1 Tax=Flavobacterium urocaniciphilum TaxID=1299341 RepID=A0A1H8YZ92_9FLAO|nr:hypothetical protein [Flavobacterium urocaniciphilum]SEP57436.1 hypothetical protein SAMN05444005_101377 [Flavobacterium urocaniciphilum]
MPKLNIDILNIFLILLSGIFAYKLPFQTFLAVYAFLGPLHYLTEINWLQQRNYFLNHKNNVFYLFVPILLIGSIVYISSLTFLKTYIPFLIFFTFLVAIFNSTQNEKLHKNWKFILFICIGFTIAYYFRKGFHIAFSIFLPSLIHVFIFTGIFILSGFLKTRNKLSLLTFIVFIVTSFLLLTDNMNSAFFMEDIQNKYIPFEELNNAVFKIFNKEILASQDIYFSSFGIRIMQFITFAYTYHYLNWFSKTSIIQWHKTSKTKISIILIIWVLSILLYIYNYNTGLYWLYLLSLSHVILEFPLNITTVKNLIKK